MPSDVAGEMAEDVVSAVNDKDDRQKEWSKTYDVNLFGQKYTVTMTVEMSLLSVPVVGDIKLGTEVTMVVLANTEQVAEKTFDVFNDEQLLAAEIRQQIGMVHDRRMTRMDYDKYGYEKF